MVVSRPSGGGVGVTGAAGRGGGGLGAASFSPTQRTSFASLCAVLIFLGPLLCNSVLSFGIVGHAFLTREKRVVEFCRLLSAEGVTG